jgi:hypothetical protein
MMQGWLDRILAMTSVLKKSILCFVSANVRLPCYRWLVVLQSGVADVFRNPGQYVSHIKLGPRKLRSKIYLYYLVITAWCSNWCNIIYSWDILRGHKLNYRYTHRYAPIKYISSNPFFLLTIQAIPRHDDTALRNLYKKLILKNSWTFTTSHSSWQDKYSNCI